MGISFDKSKEISIGFIFLEVKPSFFIENSKLLAYFQTFYEKSGLKCFS